ncbi:hypothetical protein M569_06758 [Genlisea aurea]|uniref:Uncharacterized protein n=1 Tax=Genlisea aurea TaxID=192259 RepID=S8DXK6_9LAMI|nr:hypothetical protein M569_06758 [Genlisea aurea]
MEILKATMEAFDFAWNLQFLRMAVMWPLSLMFLYMKLFLEAFFFRNSIYYSRCSLKDSALQASSVSRPVCVITGATSGLGAAAAYALSQEGFYVVLVGRSFRKLSESMSSIRERNRDACLKAFEVDLSSFKSIAKFKNSLEQWLVDSNLHPSIQILINNAGIIATSRRITPEGYDQMLATNYIGAFFLTKLLLPLLENSPSRPRVVNVTSFTHWNVCCANADTETVTGMSFMDSRVYPYAQIYEFSKLCLLASSYELHRQVKSRHLSVVAVDPGTVKTDLLREVPSAVSSFAFAMLKLFRLLHSPETGVIAILNAALAPPEVSGVYFFGGDGRTLKSSPMSYDTKFGGELWRTSCDLMAD